MAICKNKKCSIGECDQTEGCVAYVPVVSNADRIRAMSDEGLAKLFTQAVANGCPPEMDWDCAKEEYGWDACDACWCKWLNQPVEVEND